MGKRGRTATSRLKNGERGAATSTADRETAADMFEYACAVIDSAVTGGILAGIHPSCIEPVLAFWFLTIAARVRDKPADTATSWLKGDVFDAVLRAVARFARSQKPRGAC